MKRGVYSGESIMTLVLPINKISGISPTNRHRGISGSDSQTTVAKNCQRFLG